MKVYLIRTTFGTTITVGSCGSHFHVNDMELFYGILDKLPEMGQSREYDFVEDLWVPASLTPHYHRRDWVILHDTLQRSLSE